MVQFVVVAKHVLKHLSKDPVMKDLIDTYTLPDLPQDRGYFLDLIESIIGQQLSEKAGDVILKRFYTLFDTPHPSPVQILSVSDDAIRERGISYSKISYMKGLSNAVIEQKINLDSLPTRSDEEIISELIMIKGIGRWTAEMFLIFSLGREDVFSLGDTGLRNAVSKLYGIDKKNLKKIEEISLTWSPYRSTACRYLWKSLGNTPVESKKKLISLTFSKELVYEWLVK